MTAHKLFYLLHIHAVLTCSYHKVTRYHLNILQWNSTRVFCGKLFSKETLTVVIEGWIRITHTHCSPSLFLITFPNSVPVTERTLSLSEGLVRWRFVTTAFHASNHTHKTCWPPEGHYTVLPVYSAEKCTPPLCNSLQTSNSDETSPHISDGKLLF